MTDWQNHTIRDLPRKILMEGGQEAFVPPGFNPQGEIAGMAFAAWESIPRRKILISGPAFESAYQAATQNMILSLSLIIGLYTPDFEDGGGI